VNHVSDKIGAPKGTDPEHVPGGGGLRFHAKITARMRSLIFNETYVTIRPTTKKNKTAPPRRDADIKFWMGLNGTFFGVDVSDELAELGKTYSLFLNKKGEVHAAGHYYYGLDEDGAPIPILYKDQPVGSKEVLVKALDADADLREKVERDLLDAMYSSYAGKTANDDIEDVFDSAELEEESED
jgi:hypothetical protein